MNPEQIAARAQAVREAGVPDSLNRWLTATPEDVARVPKPARIRMSRREIKSGSGKRTDLPKTMTPEAWALLREIETKQKFKSAEKFKALRERTKTMPQKIGPRELALREMRERQAAKAPPPPKKPPKPPKNKPK